MSPRAAGIEELLVRGRMDESPELRLLFHRLNNQLGIILAHAELLEAKAPDDMSRTSRKVSQRALHDLKLVLFVRLRVLSGV